MALIMMEGFPLYKNSAGVLYQTAPLYTWRTYSNTEVLLSYARFASYGLRTWDHSNGGAKWSFTNNYGTFVFGTAIRLPDTASAIHASYPTISFRDGTSQQVGLHISDTDIAVYRGTTLLGTAVGAVAAGGAAGWYYLEVKVTIDSSVGSVEVRVDGTTVLNLTGINTQSTANSYINRLDIIGRYSGKGIYYDDIYFCDTTGSKCNDFLGDCRVDNLVPNAVGTNNDFTKSAGTYNYQNVDDNGDADSTYNYSGTLNAKDTYGVGDLPDPPAGTTIFGVAPLVQMRKDDAGNIGAKTVVLSGSTEAQSAEYNQTTEYIAYYGPILEDNPDDSAAWTDADINALEVGATVSSVS